MEWQLHLLNSSCFSHDYKSDYYINDIIIITRLVEQRLSSNPVWLHIYKNLYWK